MNDPTPSKQLIAERLREARRLSGLTQQSLVGGELEFTRLTLAQYNNPRDRVA